MRFAVLMRKQFIDNPWITFRWAPHEVLPDYGQFTNNPISGDKISGQFLGRATNPCWLVQAIWIY